MSQQICGEQAGRVGMVKQIKLNRSDDVQVVHERMVIVLTTPKRS